MAGTSKNPSSNSGRSNGAPGAALVYINSNGAPGAALVYIVNKRYVNLRMRRG